MKHLDIPVLRDDPRAIIPSYANVGDAGFDLHAVLAEGIDVLQLAPGQRMIVGTGLRMAIPQGWELQIRPRSGHAAKNGISVLNAPGTIDSPYRGPIGVILINHGENDFEIRTGDRIAQGVLSEVPTAAFNEVFSLEGLGMTIRGDGGFGSTGKS